jgi:hypothetical protein
MPVFLDPLAAFVADISSSAFRQLKQSYWLRLGSALQLANKPSKERFVP